MSWRTTLVLLAVAALLGAGIWFSNRREVEKQEAEEQAKRLFPALESSAIEWVAFTTEDDRPARLVRKDGAWRVAEPVDFPADPTAADSIAGTLATMSSEAVIEDPQPPAVYGLADGATVVRFGADGAEHELRIGKPTPVGGYRYASTGSGEGAQVYTIAMYKASAFEKPLDDLRERRPLRFEREDVTRIEADWAGGGAVVEKQNGTWKLVEPIAGDADESTIETLLSDLAFLRAEGFVDEPPPPAEVGLERPEYRVVLTGKAAEGQEPPRWELAIGSTIDTNLRAGRAAEPALYKIAEDRFQALPKKLDAFRFKQLSRFVASDAERFELVFHDLEAAEQGASNVVTITGTRTDAGWDTGPEPMAAGTASRLVAELARLDAVDIAAEEVGPQELAGLGLAPPRVAIRVFGRNGDAEAAADEAGDEAEAGARAETVLADLQLGVQSGDRIVARRADRPTIFRMDAALAEHIPVSLEAFRNRFVSKEKPAEEEAAEPDAGAEAEPEAGAEAPDASDTDEPAAADSAQPAGEAPAAP